MHTPATRTPTSSSSNTILSRTSKLFSLVKRPFSGSPSAEEGHLSLANLLSLHPDSKNGTSWDGTSRGDACVPDGLYLLANDSGRGLDTTVPLLDFVYALPPEIVSLIFSFMDPDTLMACLAVSRAWRAHASDDRIWRALHAHQPRWRFRDPTVPALTLSPRPASLLPPPLPSLAGARTLPAFPGWRPLHHTRRVLERRWQEGKLRAWYMEGHHDSVYCVQFDTEKIISGSRDRTVKVWDPRTGACTATLSGHTGSVLCLRYDARWMVTGSSDTTIILWSLPGHKAVRQLRGHDGGVLDVAFDDEIIVSASKDTTIQVWSMHDGSRLRTLRGHLGPVNAVQMCGDRIVSAGGDASIRVWDRRTGECLRVLLGHQRGLACVRFDGKTIVSGGNDQYIGVWDVETGRCLRQLEGHTALVRSLWFDDRWIVSASYDRTVKVWNREKGTVVLDLMNGHQSWVFDVQFDGSRIVSVSQDKKIVIWDFGFNMDVRYVG